jgi:Domain of unknown function (DUF4160)
MPTIFTINSVKFYIYFRDHGAAHCHVVKNDCHVKMILETQEVVEVNGFTKRDVVRIAEIVKERKQELLEAWEKCNE